MERVRGIEPPSEAWEAPALPLSYTRPPRIIGDPQPTARAPPSAPISVMHPTRQRLILRSRPRPSPGAGFGGVSKGRLPQDEQIFLMLLVLLSHKNPT